MNDTLIQCNEKSNEVFFSTVEQTKMMEVYEEYKDVIFPTKRQ